MLVGQSGVGKSTLVNALVPDASAPSARSARSARAGTPRRRRSRCRCPAAGWVIDTPGIRSFGLAHVAADDVLAAFPDLAAGAEACPPGCDHSATADGAALDAWVAAGNAEPRRLESFRRLLRARSGEEHW